MKNRRFRWQTTAVAVTVLLAVSCGGGTVFGGLDHEVVDVLSQSDFAENEREFAATVYLSYALTLQEEGRSGEVIRPAEFAFGELIAGGYELCTANSAGSIAPEIAQSLYDQYRKESQVVRDEVRLTHAHLCPEVPDPTIAPEQAQQEAAAVTDLSAAAEPTAEPAQAESTLPPVVPTPTRVPAPTPDPYRYRFDADHITTANRGSYNTGTKPCSGMSDPVWLTVTRFVWVCDNGEVIAADATLGRETWIAQLPVDDTDLSTRRSTLTTVPVASGLVDLAMVTIAAQGLSAETYEAILTVVDGDTGETVEHRFGSSTGEYWFRYAPLYNRALITVPTETQMRTVIINTDTGAVVADRTDIAGGFDTGQIGRWMPTRLVTEPGVIRYLDVVDAELTARRVETETRRYQQHSGLCDAPIAVNTKLFSDWAMLDPTTNTPPVDLPDLASPKHTTPAGTLIFDGGMWAMLTNDGITWQLSSDVAKDPHLIGNDLVFRNQSNDWITVDPNSGSELGPSPYEWPPGIDHTVDGGHINTDRRNVTYTDPGLACPVR